MNSYKSALRTMTARNIAEKAIAPPADLQVDPTDFKTQIFEAGQRSQPAVGFQYVTGSNLILHRAGIFCNFADGLVFKTPYERILLAISATPFTVSAALTGTVSMTANSKNIVGVGTAFNTPGPDQLLVGTRVRINSVYFIVETVTSDVLASVTDYGVASAGVPIYKLSFPVPPAIVSRIYSVDTLNYMFEQESFFPASTLGGNILNYYLSATATILNPIFFMTRSIDDAYDRETAYFDVKADFEINLP